MQIKRVVTAVDEDGKSVFQEDAVVPSVTADLFPGTDIWVLWGTEGQISSPVRTPAQNRASTFFPGPGGTRFGIFTFPPEQRDAPPPAMPDEETMAKLAADVEEKLPGLLAYLEPDNPGMHTTDTIDFEVVLSGEVVLELDDGAKKVLRPGDTVVQNGTRHRWGNPGTEPAVLAVFLIGAHRAGE